MTHYSHVPAYEIISEINKVLLIGKLKNELCLLTKPKVKSFRKSEE